MRRAVQAIVLLLLTFSFSHDVHAGEQPIVTNPTLVTLVIKSHQSGTMPSTMVGIKSGKVEFGQIDQFFTGTNSRSVSNLRALSPISGQSCILSIGADGNIPWVPEGHAQTPGQISRADIDALASFVREANCKLDYTASIVNNTPADAASELAYVDSVAGENLLAVGFGNEPDSTGDVAHATAYAQTWNTFAKAALALDPNLRFKGPDTGIATDLAVWLTAWYQENASLPLAYGSQHYYVSGPADCSACTEALMLERRSTEAYWNAMLSQKAAFEDALTKPFPVLLTETNNFYNGGAPGLSNSYGAALYAFDFVLQAAQAGFAATAFSTLDNWSQGYSPLNIVDGYSYGPRPEYYGIYMAALTGYGPMLSTSIQDADGLHAYTVEDRVNGTLNTALINTTNTSYKVHAVYPPGTHLQLCSSIVMSDDAGITDTLAAQLNIQGGHFDSNSGIVLESPYPVPVEAATAQIQIAAYTGMIVKCTH